MPLAFSQGDLLLHPQIFPFSKKLRSEVSPKRMQTADSGKEPNDPSLVQRSPRRRVVTLFQAEESHTRNICAYRRRLSVIKGFRRCRHVAAESTGDGRGQGHGSGKAAASTSSLSPSTSLRPVAQYSRGS
ncbi:hypothetical protein J6590_062757 [Homalodisca vitripennis]|nr:hypothetical protein J6590_062757 [Homalodisca vitripennis]